MKKVILNLAVLPPGYDKVQHPGAIVELEDELADRYVNAGYGFFEGERMDLSAMKKNRIMSHKDGDDNGSV